MFKKVVDPFVTGVFAGDPATLSMSDCLPRVIDNHNVSATRFAYMCQWLHSADCPMGRPFTATGAAEPTDRTIQVD
jgi:hypothetical protein